MELFIASIPRPKTIPVIVEDVHSESHALGYCEFCWNQDSLVNLVLLHDGEHNHILSHETCATALAGWQYCTCQ